MKKLLLLSCMLCCFLSGWAQDDNEHLIKLDSIVTTIGDCVAVPDADGNYHIAVAKDNNLDSMKVYISPFTGAFVSNLNSKSFASRFGGYSCDSILKKGDQVVYIFSNNKLPENEDSLNVIAKFNINKKFPSDTIQVFLKVYSKPQRPQVFSNEEETIKDFDSLKTVLGHLFAEEDNSEFDWKVIVTDKENNEIVNYDKDNTEIKKNSFEAGEYTVQLIYSKQIGNETLKVTYGYSFNYAPEPIVIESMSIVGDLTGGWPNDETNDWSMAKAMTKSDDNDAVWTLTLADVELEAKAYYYKAVANQKWGDYELPETGNNEYVINEAGKYTLNFTANTEEHTLTLVAEKQQVIPEPVVIESMSIVGDLTGGWPDNETNDWSMAKAMTKSADNDAVWTLTLTDVELEAKAYYYKAVANQKWGDCDLPETGNNEYVINEAGKYTLNFTANTEEHTLTLVAEKQQVIPEITKVELRGDWNWNSAEGMTKAGENTWTMTLDLTASDTDQQFKLFINDESEIGKGSDTKFEAPEEGWIDVESGDNWILKNSQTGYQTYTVTATWEPNEYATAQWTLKFEGKDVRPQLSIAPKTLQFDAKGNSIDENGGVVKVESNVEWKTEVSDNWISVESQNENNEVTITVTPNADENEREGQVFFKIENTDIVDTLTVKQEGIGPMPTIVLTKNPNKTNVYSDTEIKLNFSLQDKDENKLTSLEDYTWTWNGVESKDTEFTYTPTTKENKKDDKVVLAVTRIIDNKTIKDSVEFIVWPQPQVTVQAEVEGKPETVSSGAQLSPYFDQTVKLTVIPKGGANEWTYSWEDGDSEPKTDSSLSIIYDEAKNPRTIKLTVKNSLSDDELEWSQEYTFTINFVKRPAANITLKKNPNVDAVFNGREIEFSFELDNNGIPVDKKDFEWTWLVDDVEKAKGGDTFTYQAEANILEGYKVQTVGLRLTRTSDNDTGSRSSIITVWSQPVAYANGEQLDENKTMEKEMEQNESWKLNISREGGNTNDSHAWTYKWYEEDNEITDGRNYEIQYNGKDARKVKLVITNCLSGQNGNESTGKWTGTYQFIAHFKEPVKGMPRIKLNGFMDGAEAPDNLLTGSQVDMSFSLFDQETDESITDLSGYSWKWDDGSSENAYSFTAKNDQEDGAKLYEVKFTLTRNSDGKSITSTKTYQVWPKANVTPTPADRSLSSLTESNKELGFGLTTMGGYSQGWKFLWRAEERELSDTRICNLKYEDFKDRKDTLELKLRVTNQAPEYQGCWFDAEYSFFVKFTGESGIVILSSKDEFMKGENVNVLGNDIVKLSYQASTPLTGTEWTADNNAKVDGDIITFPNVEEKSMVKVTLKSKEASDAEKIFIVWPEPQLDDISWSMKFKDNNNSSNENMPTSSVRSGNTIQLADVPSLKGGYEGNCEPLVRLKGNSNSLLSNRNEWKVDGNLPFENGIYKGAIEYVAQTSFDNNELMGERVVASYPITVYQKPSTPTSLALKGNGTSGTWYVSGYDGKDGALRLYDNGVEKKIEGHANDWSWIIQDGSAQQDKANGYYVVNAKDYGKGVVITSGKRSVSGVDEEWDGSVYGSSGSVHQAPQQTVAGQYSINGVQTNEFVRGLNIIRLEDGTVRKVFKK